MRRRRRAGAAPIRAAVAAPIAVLSIALLPAGVWAADTIRSEPNFVNDFDRDTYFSDPGELVRFKHPGLALGTVPVPGTPGPPHNVTSFDVGPDGQSFRSDTIRRGTTPVNGTQNLAPGAYPFYCTVHGAEQMSAQLVVSGTSGTSPELFELGFPPASPSAPRPDIEVKILSRDLDKVVGKGKLAAKIRAVTESEDARLVARFGKKVLAKKGNIDLAGGEARKVRLKLGKKARALLEDRNKAKVALKGTVPSGLPDTFKRVLK
jgi:plastocyanin